MRLRISSAIINAVLISLTVSSAVSYDPPTNLLYQRTRMREPPSVNSISTTNASPVNDPNNECSNHVDGLYSYGCKPQYFACSNGAVYHFECPSELVFNDEYSVCDYPAAVKSCAGKYEVSNKDNEVYEEVTQATRPVYEKKHVYERPTTTPITTTQVPRTGDIDCSRLADGTYSSGCSSEFTVCSNGFTYNQLCPDGLVFNPTGGYCDYPDNCGETTTAAYETRTTTTTNAPSTGSSHCADLPDGVHSFGCQEEYIVCQSGRTLTGRCPRGLVFNGNTKRCDYLENCASSTSSYESTTASPSPQVPYSTTSAPVTRECVRDGVFAEGCSSEFVVCSNGIGHRQKCPDGLVFNVDLGLCDYEHNCGATKPLEPYVTTAEPYVTVTEEPVQPTHTTSRPYVPPVDTSRTSCINGQRFSTVLCSSSFSECRNGGYLLKTCPTGTLFDSKYGLCMYDVSACRPQKNYDTSATNSPVYATPASAPINVPVSVSKGLCQGGTNYPRGACMSTYLYCRDGLSFDQKECPANHRFDPVNLDCRMPFLISSCYKEGEKVDEPVYINNADHEDIDYVRYGYSDNEVFVRHGRRHDDDTSDSSEEQDSKYLKDDFQGRGPFYPDGVISNPFYKSHKFMKKIPNGRHRHHHRRHRHGSRRNGFDIFGGDEPHFTVVSNPFYPKRGHYVKNVRLPDAFDKKMGRLTDSIYRFFPDSKRSVSEKKLTAVFTRGDNRRRDSFEEDSWEQEHDKADKKWSSKVQGSVDVPVKEDAELPETTTAPIIEALAEQAKIATVDEDDREEEAETSTTIVNDETSTAIVNDETSTAIVDDETSTTIVDEETSTTIVDEETSTTIVDDEIEEQSVVVDEGSGIEDEEVARSKRYAPVNPSAADSSMCGQGSAMQTVAVGHCHHNFILCNENLQAQVAACPVGETFDAVNKVCVELCGRESESTARVQPIDQYQTQSEQVSETFQETVSQPESEWNGEQKQQDSARYQEVVEEVRQEHMHPIQDDDSYDQSENIAPRPAQDVLLTSNQEQASSGPCAARPNGVYTMGCSGSFLTCSNGQSYVTNCPNGLVFDAATAVCNVPEQVAECDGRVQADTGAAPVAGPMIPRPHEYRPVDFVDTFYNSPQSPKANFVQEDSNFNAGSYNAKDVPVVDLFNESENVVNGPSQPSVPINIWNAPQDTVGQTMQPTGEQLPIQRAEPSTCTGRQYGGYRLDCSGTFVICSYGSAHIFNCQPGLHFDEASQACVYSSSACQTAAAPADPYRVQNVANVPSQPIVPGNVWNGPQNMVETQNAVNGPHLIVPTNAWSAPGNSAEQTVPQNVDVPMPIQRAEPSVCVGRQDGGYRLDCAGTFVICSYGSAHVFNCQPGLHFDEASQACVYSSSACQTAAAPADPYRVQNVANVPSQPIVPSNVWNGAQNAVETQNAVNGPQTVHTNVWSAPGNSAEQTVPQNVDVPMPIQRAEPSVCVGRQDGGYRIDCAGTFVICSYGSAHVFNCQPELHFDEASQACVDSSSACQTAAAPADSYRVQELPIVPSLVSTPVSVAQQQPTHVRDSAQSETYQAEAYRPEIVPTTRSDASSDRVRAQPTFAGQGADNSVNHQSSRPYVPQVTATPQNEVPMSWSSQSVPESDGTIENLRSDTPYNPRFVVAASERPVGVDFVPQSSAAQDQYVNDGTPATVDNEQPGTLIPAVEYKQFDMSSSYPSATVKSWPSESVSEQGREMPRSDEPYRPNIVTAPSENSFGDDTVSTSPVQEQSISEWEEAMDSEQPYRPSFVVVPSSEKSSDGDSLSKSSADEDYLNTNGGSKHTGVPTESEQTERLSPGDKTFHEVASQDETSYAPEVEITRTDASIIPHRPVMIPSSVASDEGSVLNEGSEVVIATNAPYAPKIEEDSTSEQVFVPSTVDSNDWKTDATQPDFEKHSDMVTESTIPHRPDSQIFESAGRESEVTVPTNDKRHYVSDKDAEVEKFDNKQDKNVDNTNTRVLPIVIVPDVAGDESAMNQGTFKSDDLCSGSDVIIGAACAEEFIACLDGRPLRMTCSQGTVFDDASKSCISKEAIQECSVPASDQNDMSESVTETVDETKESEGEFIEDLTPESTDGDQDSVDDEATSLPAVIDDATASALTTGLPCDPEAHPTFPVAACSITYAVCHEDGFARAVNCSSTQLFDHILYECVPSELCGHSHFKELLAAIEMGEGLTSAREACIGAKSGHKRFLGECRRSYAVCGRRPTIERCPRDHVFSKAKNACVNKKTIGACRAQVNKSTMTEFKKTESTNTAVQTPARSFDGEPGTFCSDREDGLYRHPTECSGIVQCLGGRMIDRRSCTSGLVFNEKTKQCDYATDEKCSRASPLAQDATGCDGHEHGAHFEDAHNCSIFYRCVWNRKVQMDCAPGTLFNKDLSVCDWPSAVPDCVDGVRESEGDDNTAEEDHDVAADDDREHDDYDDEQKVDNHDFIEPVVAQDEDKPEVSDDEYKPQISKDEADADVDTEADAYDHA